MADTDRICPRCTRLWGPEHEVCPNDGQQLLVFARADDSRVGTVVDGRFTIIGVLGSGGMGAVYRALQHTMEREVAIKILKASYAEDPGAVQRFLQEAKFASKVHHPNVITLFDFGQTAAGELYLSMELLRGRTLREIQEQEGTGIGLSRAVAILAQVCDALGEAHSAGVVHRDLKPENIFVLPGAGAHGEFVKVIDFGIAKVKAVEGTEAITQTGMVFGTPHYMSPEQALGLEVDGRSDLYAVAVLLYELLAGLPPFHHDTLMKVIMAQVHEDPPSLAEACPGVPPEVAAVVDGCLAKSPDDRPQDASELKRQLLEAALGAAALELPTLSSHPPPRPSDTFADTVASDSAEQNAAADTAETIAAVRPPHSPMTAVESAETVAADSVPPVAPFDEQEPGPGSTGGAAGTETHGPAPRSRRALAAALVAAVLLVAGGATALLHYRGRAPSDRAVTSAGNDAAADAPGHDAPRHADFPPRMESSRPLLRIGSTNVGRIYGGGLTQALFWKNVQSRADDETSIPLLVVEEPTLDNGGARPRQGGGLVVTWRLRPGLRWSDGSPFHSRDLAFCLTTFRSPHLIRATAPDAQTLIAEWDDRHSDAFRPLCPYQERLLGPVAKAQGSGAVLEALRATPTAVMGPYKVESFEPGKRLVVVANPHFPGPPPSIPRLELIQEDAAGLTRAYEAGEIDAIYPNHISLEQARALRQRQPLAVHIRPSAVLVSLLPDQSVPLLAKREVRRAILQAIDRVALAEGVYGPTAEIAHAPVLGALPRGAVQHAHDPVAARAAIAASGGRGEEVLLIHADTVTARALGDGVAESLEAVGLRVAQRVVSAAERTVLERSGAHGGLLLRAVRVGREGHVLRHWNVPIVDGNFVRTTRNDGFDDLVASLVERQERSIHPDRRRQLRDQIIAAYTERLPTIPLTFTTERVVAHPDLRGWDSDPREPFGTGIETWYFVAPSRP